jgi:hypothetical protein
MKTLRVKAENKLERFVKSWINEKAQDYEDVRGVYEDLMHRGCASGYVSDLICYADTGAFFKKYKKEISVLLKEAVENCGPVDLVFGDKWDKEDPLAYEYQNQNLLAWFGFEETARALFYRAGIK